MILQLFSDLMPFTIFCIVLSLLSKSMLFMTISPLSARRFPPSLHTPQFIDKKFLDKKFWLKNRYFLHVFWGRNLDPRKGVADAEFYGKSTEIHGKSAKIHGKSMENPQKSMETPWKIRGNPLKFTDIHRKSMGKPWQSTENPRKSVENHGNPGKKLIWQRWPATWSSEPSCMLGYRNNLSMHSQNTPKKSVRNKKVTEESDPNN